MLACAPADDEPGIEDDRAPVEHVEADVQIERGLSGAFVVEGPEAIDVAAERVLVLDDVKLDAAVTGGAHLTWTDASDDEDEFAIERKGSSGDFAELDAVPFDTTQYHDGTATAGTWVYRVATTNDAGESWSAEVSVTIE